MTSFGLIVVMNLMTITLLALKARSFTLQVFTIGRSAFGYFRPPRQERPPFLEALLVFLSRRRKVRDQILESLQSR